MQESSLDRTKVHKPTVIEVGGEPLGVVVPHENGFRFLAVRLPAFVIDGEHFPTIDAARFAVSQAVRNSGDAS